jgi:hypothetical protein
MVSLSNPKGTDMLARTFWLALAVLISQSPAAAQTGRADVETAYPTFGVALTGPAGWVRLPGGGAGAIARWGKVSPGTNEVVAVVTAEVEPVTAEPATEYAKRLAKQLGGKVSPAAIAGVKGFRITAGPPEKPGPSPSAALVVRRGSLVYVLTAIDVPENSAADALETVRSGWQWVPVEPVTKHLNDLSDPFVALGKVSLQVPTVARPGNVKDATRQLHLSLFDYMAVMPVMDIEVVTTATGGDSGRTRDSLNQFITQQRGAGQPPLTWRELAGTPKRWVTNSFDNSNVVAGRKEPVTTVSRYALIEIGKGEAAVLTLQYVLGTPGERATFEEASDAIIRSLSPAKAAGTETATGPAPTPAAPAGPRGDGSIQIKRKPPRGAKASAN